MQQEALTDKNTQFVCYPIDANGWFSLNCFYPGVFLELSEGVFWAWLSDDSSKSGSPLLSLFYVQGEYWAQCFTFIDSWSFGGLKEATYG